MNIFFVLGWSDSIKISEVLYYNRHYLLGEFVGQPTFILGIEYKFKQIKIKKNKREMMKLNFHISFGVPCYSES